MSGAAPEASRSVGDFGPALLSLAFVALATWTWGLWPDVLVDFGRELYVPWRIREGAVLYRDLAYFNGPLSPYLDALWFAIGGASVHTLFWANLALLALFTALLYRTLVALGDPFSALIATVTFLCTCAFGQLVGIGNYNFVAPYSNEATHGLLLGLGVLAAIERWRARGRPVWLAIGGLCAGLALLTKPEMALAVLAAGLAALVCTDAGEEPRPRPASAAGIFFLALLVPLVTAAALLSLAMPLGEALAGIAMPWRALVSSEITSQVFYRRSMGIDRPGENAAAMFLWAGAWCLALAPAVVAGLLLRSGGRAVDLAVAALYAVALLALRGRIHWLAAAKPLPLVAALSVGACGMELLRRRLGARGRVALPFSVLALALLGKIVLNSRLSNYGFALAAPGLVLAITALASWLPDALDRRGARGDVVRAAALALLAVFCLAHLERTAGFRAAKPIVVGAGADAFRADFRGWFVGRALAELARTPAGSTFAVLPEGATLNFLARRANSTPYVNLMPPELALFGEAAILASFKAHPPDRIVLVHKDTSEYGFPLFGREYGARLMVWVRTHYAPERPIGDEPLVRGARFGVQILLRR